jgi:hypothetical protein
MWDPISDAGCWWFLIPPLVIAVVVVLVMIWHPGRDRD